MSYLQLEPLTSTIPSSAIFLVNSIYYVLANYYYVLMWFIVQFHPIELLVDRISSPFLFKMKVNSSLAGVLHKVRIQQIVVELPHFTYEENLIKEK